MHGAAVHEAAHGRLRVSLGAAVPGRVVMRRRYQHLHKVAATNGCAAQKTSVQRRLPKREQEQDSKMQAYRLQRARASCARRCWTRKRATAAARAPVIPGSNVVTRGALAWGPADRRTRARLSLTPQAASPFGAARIFTTARTLGQSRHAAHMCRPTGQLCQSSCLRGTFCAM